MIFINTDRIQVGFNAKNVPHSICLLLGFEFAGEERPLDHKVALEVFQRMVGSSPASAQGFHNRFRIRCQQAKIAIIYAS